MFGDGLRSFLRGFALVFGDARAALFAVVPAVVCALVTVVLLPLAVLGPTAMLDRWVGANGEPTEALASLASNCYRIVSGLACALLAQPAAAPALRGLTHRARARLSATPLEERPTHVEVLDSARAAFPALIAAVAIFGLGLLVERGALAPFVSVPVKVVFAASCVSFSLFDATLRGAGLEWRERLDRLRAGRWALAGFTLGVTVVAVVPAGFLLLLPVGVAGATSLHAKIEMGAGRPNGRVRL
ncbi:MAG: hypothetical protein U0271_29745 [Polyangiaceae bacterium]